ncbi:MAG: carboxy-S-adenosyl-L-methionine synthase CmoA [Pseudomonadota bacterium]
MSKDQIYANEAAPISAFRFDDSVAAVFEDMINRSVPGYAASLAGIAGFARALVPAHGRCYDLGSSLGAATLAICQGLDDRPATIVAIDNAPAMIRQCANDPRFSDRAQDIDLVEANIADYGLQPCDLVVMNYTLQFIEPGARHALLERIFAALKPGGALLISEKFRFEDPRTHALLTELHLDFKRSNGYSETEIAGKRAALENVLIADTREHHIERLQQAGFARVTLWQATLNFGSLIAFKDD